MPCVVYIGCRMSGRDRHEQIMRAEYVCTILKQYGLTPVSPVLEEGVIDKPGPLDDVGPEKLKKLWARDKEILRREAHVMLWDEANMKSFGAEREMGLMRYCLWKPVIILTPKMNVSVAHIEDDAVTDDLHIAGEFIRAKFGTRWKRIKWRLALLVRCLPKRIVDEWYAWK